MSAVPTLNSSASTNMDDHAMAAPGDEIEPQSTSILSGAVSRDSLGAPTGSSLQTPDRPGRSATNSQRDYLHKAESDKKSLLSDEFSQSLNETPYSHRTGQVINKDVRRRAIEADPNQGEICLISNSEGLDVQLCHVVDRATPTKIIKSLEYSWGLQRPLNVDTRCNFLFLDANYHNGFDNGKFILLPPCSVVEELWSQYISTAQDVHEPPHLPYVHPDIPGKQYEYTLVPSTVMKNMTILRRDSDAVSVHEFPFDDLPTLSSVAPPHFMIWKVGRLLGVLANNQQLYHFASSKKYADLPSVLFKIMSLHHLWSTRKVPAGYETQFLHPNLPPEGESGEDSDLHSEFGAPRRRGRRGSGAEGPSQGEASGSAGQPTGSKRKRGNNDDNNIDRSSKKRYDEDRIVDIVDPDGPYMGHVDQARVRRWIINTSRSLHSRPGNAC